MARESKEKQRENILDEVLNSTSQDEEKHIELSEEDLANRRDILQFFHYDPFEKDTNEDKKQLYRDLVSLIDESMALDLPKQRAAISLVRGYLRLDKITDAIQTLSSTPESMVQNNKDIKNLSEIEKAQTAAISTISKDHGFSERWAVAKSKGSGTLSAVVRDLGDYQYDKGYCNIYDVKTSDSMKLFAEISTKAIMKQIALSDSDYKDIVKQQREEITSLHEENEKLKEENRLLCEQITKQELLKELVMKLEKKELGKREIQDMILAEISYDKNEFADIERREKDDKRIQQKKRNGSKS